MKNNFITKVIGATLAFAMMIGVGANLANNVAKAVYASTDPITFSTIGNSKVGQNKDQTMSTTEVTELTEFYYNSTYTFKYYKGKKQGEALLLTKKAGYFFNVTPMPDNIEKVNVGTASGAAAGAKYGVAFSATSYSSFTPNNTGTVNIKNGNNNDFSCSIDNARYFCVYVDSSTNSNGQVQNLVVTFKSSGGGSSSSSSNSQAPTTYTVTYVNGGATSGTVPTDDSAYASGAQVTVSGNTGNLAKNGYTFAGWTDGNNNYEAGDTFNISANTTLTATWTEDVDDGASTYQLKNMSGFSTWSNSYSDHSHTFVISQSENAAVTIKGASKQTSTITDAPVTKGGDVTFKLTSNERYIKNITFHARQWSDKAQTMTLHTSTNGGSSYTNTEISTDYFLIRGSNLASGTNAIKITFSSSSNQVGCVDFVVTYDYLPTQQATGMTIAPATLSLYGGDDGAFTPTLSGGQGNYEKTITWESSHPSIIAAPSDSEAGETVHVTPAEVASDTDVTITGTVDAQNGASASIVITVKLIKTVSVNHVEISGIENNSVLDGSNDNTIAINKVIQLSASVSYNQGNEYMDGNNGVSWSSSDDDLATVNSTGLVTLLDNGEVTITATSTENGTKSASLTFIIENINPALGSQNNPFTVPQAIEAINARGTISNTYAEGIISRIDNINNGAITYWISADGTTSNQLEVYKGKNISGASFSALSDIELGASVVITGTLKLYNTTYEFDQNNRIVSYTDPSDEARLNTYLNTTTSFVSINATENRSSYVEPETLTFGTLGLTNAQQYSEFDGGHFTISFAGGDNDGKYYTDGSAIRTYGGGAISIASDEPISKIEYIWVGGNSYKPATDEVVNVGEYSASSAVWTGNANLVTLTRPSGSGHWRLSEVTVTYGALTSVSDVKLRFGASISTEKWDAINNLQDYEITDYGVMLFKTKEQYAETAPTVQTLYAANPANVQVFAKGSGVAPTAENGEYTFTARIDYTNDEEYSKYIIAQAFIVVNGQRRFVGVEMRASVRSLAGTANVNTNLSPDALTYLTTAGN